MKKVRGRNGKGNAADWTKAWMKSVCDRSNRMSARKLSSVVKRGGGIQSVVAAARKHRVHLVLLEDDRGNKLIAASKRPFKVLA